MEGFDVILMNLFRIWEEGGALMWPLILLSVVLYYQIFDLLIRFFAIEKNPLQEELNFIESRLSLVSRMIKVVPLVGLLGTVLGIIATFSVIGIDIENQEKEIALGISEALITTQYGLLISIPAMVMFSFIKYGYHRQVKYLKKGELYKKVSFRLSQLDERLV